MKVLYFLAGLCIAPICFAQSECHFFSDGNEIESQQLAIASPASLGFNRQKLALVDQQINQDIKNGFPGAGLLIIKDGNVIKQSVYGYKLKYSRKTGKKLAKPELMQCTTLFDLASNTKMYATNYAVMHLVFEGRLDITKRISYYLPDYQGCDLHGQCREDRRVSDLLTHRAGYPPDPQFFNPQVSAEYGAGFYSQNRATTESIILTKLPFARALGAKPVYSDVDFILLGMLIEKITGQPLDQYLAATIYQPLGLKQTLFNPIPHSFNPKQCAATEIQGNTRGGSVTFPNIRTRPVDCQVHDEKAYYSMGGVSGHAGLFSNLGDMAVLTQLMLNNGSYNKLQLWDKTLQQHFIEPLASDDTYGLGWRLAGSAANRYPPFGEYASQQAFGHTGWTGTLTLIDPKYNLAIILLTNKKHSIYANGKFAGDDFATGKYHEIINLIYQALPEATQTPNN